MNEIKNGIAHVLVGLFAVCLFTTPLLISGVELPRLPLLIGSIQICILIGFIAEVKERGSYVSWKSIIDANIFDVLGYVIGGVLACVLIRVLL